MIPSIESDVVILGGGIAGLWALGRLLESGYSALLLESQALGGVQTTASQGIIHGGTKYALTGKLTGSSQAIAGMPGIWRSCMEGRGELDLTRVGLLSDHQFLWSTGSLASEMTGFFASRSMRSRVASLPREQCPELLQDERFHGHVYRLEEPVLDVPSLVGELERRYGHASLKMDPVEGLRFGEGSPPALEITDPSGSRLQLRPRHLVLAAGVGNERLLASLGRAKPAMQRRPLHMLMVRGELPSLFAHCLGVGASPRVTVTSHPAGNGERVWYLGGQVAEAGVGRSEQDQIAAGRLELRQVLPWLDTSGLRWACLRVDRAEPRQAGGRRPDRPFMETRDGVSVAWPTKLAFAPALAKELLGNLRADGIRPTGDPLDLPDWPRPGLASFPWETVQQWN